MTHWRTCCRCARPDFAPSPDPCVSKTLITPSADAWGINLSQEYVPKDKLQHVKRVIYGLNQGAPVADLPLEPVHLESARQRNFDLRSALFKAAPEQLRPARVVRIGLVQNMIVLPTTAPFEDQAKVRVRTWRRACLTGCAGTNGLRMHGNR